MSYDFDQQQRGMSSNTKVILGCAGMAFLCVALICGGIIFWSFRLVENVKQVAHEVIERIEKQADAFATRFEAQGYQRVTGQTANINSDIKQPTVYTVQVFRLNANSDASLAVMAQAAEINGRIDGDFHFYGQSLTIHPDAVITGNLNVEMAQVFENNGTVEGDVIRTESEFNFDEEEMREKPGDDAGESPDPERKPSPGDVIDKSTEDNPEPGTASESNADSLTPVPQHDDSPATEATSSDDSAKPATKPQSSN